MQFFIDETVLERENEVSWNDINTFIKQGNQVTSIIAMIIATNPTPTLSRKSAEKPWNSFNQTWLVKTFLKCLLKRK